MKRKVTELEKKLRDNGYSLYGKTYCGKDSNKISGYIYKNITPLIEYYIYLDKTREHIDTFGFSNDKRYIDKPTLEELLKTNQEMTHLVCSIYDFDNKKVILGNEN